MHSETEHMGGNEGGEKRRTKTQAQMWWFACVLLCVKHTLDIRLWCSRGWLNYHLFRVQALGHRPRADHVVHDALAECLGHLVQLHELAHIVQHIVVLGRRRRHLLNNGGDVAEDRRVQQSCPDTRKQRQTIRIIGYVGILWCE